MTKRIIYLGTCLILLGGFLVGTINCGGKQEQTVDPNTPKGNPPLPPDTGGGSTIVDPPGDLINLHLHATAKASSAFDDHYRAILVRDFRTGNTDRAWATEGGGQKANVELSLMRRATVSKVKLWDNSSDNYNLKKGYLTFADSTDPGATFEKILVDALPPDGATPLEIPVPDYLVDRITLHITNYEDKLNPKDPNSGISEFQVIGRFEDVEVERQNLMPFAHVTTIAKVKLYEYAPGKYAEFHGRYGILNIGDHWMDKDKENCEALSSGDHAYISEGAGDNNLITAEFDQEYAIDKVVFYDIQDDEKEWPRIKRFNLKIGDSFQHQIDTADGSRCTVVDVKALNGDVPVIAKTLEWEVAGPGDGYEEGEASVQHDTGIQELRVFGKSP